MNINHSKALHKAKLFSCLEDFCLYGIVDLTHSHNMPLPRLGLPANMHGTNPPSQISVILVAKMNYLALLCYYHTSLIPRSQAITARTTQCLFYFYLHLSPTLPTSIVLNQIPPTS